MVYSMTVRPRWIVAIDEDPHRGVSTPMIVIVPRDVATHDQVAGAFRRGGWVRPSRAEWARGSWTLARKGRVDVVEAKVARVSTGGAYFFPYVAPDTSPRWRSAARETRALVALVPHDSFPEETYSDDRIRDRIAALVARRAVTAALVDVRFDDLQGPRLPERGTR